MSLRLRQRSQRLAPLLLACCFQAAVGHAQTTTAISLDGSLPHGRMDVLSDLQAGPDYEVLEEHGWLAGSNLFHSFSQFDVAPTASVTFRALTPNLANVIARVTGGDISDIDGIVNSAIPGADFYLLNPAGILFGPASQVNVPASLFIGTPTDLLFAGGEELDVVNAANPVLSVAAPEAFGFAGGADAGLVRFNNSPSTSPRIELGAGENLVVAAGNFEAVNGRRSIAVPEGRIQIAAVGSATIDVPVADIGAATWEASAPLGAVSISEPGAVFTTRNTTDLLAPQGLSLIHI